MKTLRDKLIHLYIQWMSYQDISNAYRMAQIRLYQRALQRFDQKQLESELKYLTELVKGQQATHIETKTHTDQSVSEVCDEIERVFE